MNTQNYYPENASRAKAILIAGLVLIQVTLFAGENTTGKESQNTANTGNYTTEEATESEIELEDWMSNVNSSFWYDLSEAKESEPALESWMYDTQDSFWLDLSEAEDSEPELESWMYNTQDSFWFDLEEVKDPEPALESWMINPDDWTESSDGKLLTSK